MKNHLVSTGNVSYNKALLDNMAYFSDAVWVIEIASESIVVIFDKISPQLVGKQMTLDGISDFIRQHNSPEDAEQIMKMMTVGYLKKLKTSVEYTCHALPYGGKVHKMRAVVTPEFDEDGKVQRVYISFQDIQSHLNEIDSYRFDTEKAMSSFDYKELLSSAQMGLWTIVVDKGVGKFFVDEVSAELFGIDHNLSAEEAYSLYVSRLDDEAFTIIREYQSRMMDGEKSEATYSFRHPSRGMITVRSCGVIDDSYTGTGICFRGCQQDITEYHKSIEQREKMIDKYLKLNSALSDEYVNVYIVDVKTEMAEAVKELKIDVASAVGQEGDMIPYEDVWGYYIQNFVYEEDRKYVNKIHDLNNVLRDLKANNGEYTYRYRLFVKGGIHYVQFKAVMLDDDTMIQAFRSIDDIVRQEVENRKVVENAMEMLSKEKQLLEYVAGLYNTLYYISTTSNYFRQIGTPPDRIQQTLERNATIGNQEKVWTVMRRVIRKDFIDKVLEFTDFSTLEERMKGRKEVSIKAVNDEGKWVRFSFIRLDRDLNAPITAVLFASQHIDNEVRREEAHKKALEEALAMSEQASRAKSRFLNNMSHDIRTPMNAIVGFTALASTHANDKDKVLDYLKKIQTSSTHLLSLINDVLDMARIESGKVTIDNKENSLSELMHDVKNIVQADIKKKQLNMFFDTVDVRDETVMCDKLRLNQILLNILSNAIKFTPPLGTVGMKIVQKKSAREGMGTFEFHVKDTGIGMSNEFAEKIFEPFERERTSTVSGIQGTGLGMAITKNIVDMMNGTIAVKSEKGVGTEFIVTFDFELAETVQKPDHRIEKLQGVHALIADDNYDTCLSVCHMLDEIGLRPEWTMYGHEAVLRASHAKEFNDPYGVYIIDWLMPDMNGIEVVRRIRKEIGEDTPIIILTAYDWSEIEEEAKEAGVTSFCAKPIFLSDLSSILQKAVASRDGAGVSPTKAQPAAPTLEGRRILLVEDNEMNREIAEMVLSENGATVYSLSDGKDAVSHMQTFADSGEDCPYDVILMDIQMPVMDGYEATKIIRAMANPKVANIPIIACSANAFKEDREASLAAGMNEHVAKPFDIKELVQVVSRIVNNE
ncbi:MAG: response regulator [Bacteroidaceae bacterium]|nr:response regulator [Bacteroidaceae bacterium]